MIAANSTASLTRLRRPRGAVVMVIWGIPSTLDGAAPHRTASDEANHTHYT